MLGVDIDRIPCEGGLRAGVYGDKVEEDEGVFAAFVAFDIVFEVVGTCLVGVAGVAECGVGAVAEYPAVFIAVGCRVVDVDGEGFAALKRIDTGVETGNWLRVDMHHDGVTRRARCSFVGVDGLYYISCRLVYTLERFDDASSVACGLPLESGDTRL